MQPEKAPLESAPLLAGIVFESRFAINEFLANAVHIMRGKGLAVGGVLQEPVTDGSGERNLKLRSIADGWTIPVLEKRGQSARGCRLDYNAITHVSVRLEKIFEHPTDLVVINRFGRAESEGAGLRRICERAAMEAIPLLTAVRGEYLNAWRSFHGGLGTELPPDIPSVLEWVDLVVAGPLNIPDQIGSDAP